MLKQLSVRLGRRWRRGNVALPLSQGGASYASIHSKPWSLSPETLELDPCNFQAQASTAVNNSGLSLPE